MKLNTLLLACASSALGAGVAMCVLQTPLARASSDSPKEITAQKFRLVDATGECKGYFSTDPNGYPALCVTDGKGLGILLHIERNGSRSIRVFDQRDTERLRLQTSDTMQSLSFCTSAGEPSVHLGIVKDEFPFLCVGQHNTSNCYIRVENDNARLTLTNPKCQGSVDLLTRPGVAQVSAGNITGKNFAAIVSNDANVPASRTGVFVMHDDQLKWVAP